MARIGIRIGTLAIGAGGLLTAFLALSPTAAAEPAAPAIPAFPDLTQQLANAPTLASQFLQNAASMLSPKPAPASAPTPPPTASATLNLPQPAAPASPAPLTAPLTQAVGSVPPAAAAPAATSAMPLLNQLPLPGNIASIAQGIPGLGTSPGAIPSITAPMSTGPMTPPAPGAPALPPSLNPFSALP
jgi:hypothetical protein